MKMKKILLILLVVLFAYLIVDYIKQTFQISILVYDGYRNRFTQQCKTMRDTEYKPPWFNLVYISDENCNPLR